MKLDQMLAGFKETADQTLLQGTEDTADLEKRIRLKIESSHARSRRLVYSVGVALLAAVLLIGITPYYLLKQIGSGVSGTEVPPVAAVDDQVVLQQVEEIKSLLRIGLSQEELKQQLPSAYTVRGHRNAIEEDADEYWGYAFFRKGGKGLEDGAFGEKEELLQREAGAYLLVGWKEKKLCGYSLSYVQGNDVFVFKMRGNGTVAEEIMDAPRTPSVFDLTPAEQSSYAAFKNEQMDELLRGLNPIQVLKLYIKAVEEGDLVTQYALHIQDGEFEKPTLEQFLADAKNDPIGERNNWKQVKTLREFASGFSVEPTADKEAVVWITYKDNREKTAYRLQPSKKGFWKVGWLAIQ